MVTSDEVKAEFKKELEALLTKWQASVDLVEEHRSRLEHMEVYIPAIYTDDGDLVRESAQFTLGRNLY